MQNNIFYCYSKRMSYFLKSMKEKYLYSNINKNTNTRFWAFEKSDRLDFLIELWKEIKNK